MFFAPGQFACRDVVICLSASFGSSDRRERILNLFFHGKTEQWLYYGVGMVGKVLTTVSW